MRFLFLVSLLCFVFPALAQEADEGVEKALPLPRFATLKSEEVNARVGPGPQYAIRWVYRRAGMPVEIVEQFEHWRKIRDVDGDTAWVNKSMLSGKRGALIRGKEVQLLRREPEPDAPIVLRAEPNVVGNLVACEAGWCRLQIHSRKGWLAKKDFYGAYPDETFQ